MTPYDWNTSSNDEPIDIYGGDKMSKADDIRADSEAQHTEAMENIRSLSDRVLGEEAARILGGPGSGPRPGQGHTPKPGASEHVSAHSVGDTLPYVHNSGKLGHAELHGKTHNSEEWRVHYDNSRYAYSSGFKDVVAHQPK